MKKAGRKYISLAILVVTLVVINLLSSLAFFRLDLTSEKRFSIGKSSREILSGLQDVVYVRVFLDGDLPADLSKFRQSVKELLVDFKAYAGTNFEFEFVDIYSDNDTRTRNSMMEELEKKGLRVTDFRVRNKQGGYSTQLAFPGAILTYRGTEFPVNLLKNNPGLPAQVNFNNSVQSLEYEFIRAIKSLTGEKVEKIAFIEGHRELDLLQVNDISRELSLFFQVDRGAINGNLPALLAYKALVIAQPLDKFNDRDKFALDQYIMHGGRVLFFLDPVQTFSDSLTTGRTFTMFQDVNLFDLLFKYGVRVDYNLVKDIQCNYIRVETSTGGQNSKLQWFPWVYYPLITAPEGNIITKGLNYIKTEFVSALDTTPAPMEGLKRTVLLASSDSSALIVNPGFISMSEVTEAPDHREFSKSKLPVAILAEGKFPSFYKNYGVPDGVITGNTDILSESRYASIFVSGDGDMIRNDVQVTASGNVPLPLGYDKDTRQTFGNKDFVMNLVNYMTDDASLITLRSKEYKLRLIDKSKIRTSSARLKWQLINTVSPLVIILVSGILFTLVRKRKYAK